MANITPRKNKDGSTSYRVKVSAGVGADGRYIYRSATFTPPPKLSARKEVKAVQEFADDFERRVQEGLFVANEGYTVDQRRSCITQAPLCVQSDVLFDLKGLSR